MILIVLSVAVFGAQTLVVFTQTHTATGSLKVLNNWTVKKPVLQLLIIMDGWVWLVLTMGEKN